MLWGLSAWSWKMAFWHLWWQALWWGMDVVGSTPSSKKWLIIRCDDFCDQVTPSLTEESIFVLTSVPFSPLFFFRSFLTFWIIIFPLSPQWFLRYPFLPNLLVESVTLVSHWHRFPLPSVLSAGRIKKHVYVYTIICVYSHIYWVIENLESFELQCSSTGIIPLILWRLSQVTLSSPQCGVRPVL